MTCARYLGQAGGSGGLALPPGEGAWATRRLPRRRSVPMRQRGVSPAWQPGMMHWRRVRAGK
jgi:hypothetical protein